MPETVENTTPTTESLPTGSEVPPAEDLRFSTQAKGEPFEVAVLALQNLTIFPETVVPLGIGRPRSIAAVEAALSTQEKLLGCITVRPDRSIQQSFGSNVSEAWEGRDRDEAVDHQAGREHHDADPHPPDQEPLGEREQEQHGREHHGRADVFVGLMP